MDNDLFGQLLVKNIANADHPENRQHITLHLLGTEPLEQDMDWWDLRAGRIAQDKDIIGWHLSLERRLAVRVN